MTSDQYVWLIWSGAFLLPWAAVYIGFPRHRKAMLWASLFTMPFGLTKPLFVPEYWSPPSLFDLARRTGFDIESLIFCFGVGGIAAVLYNILTGRSLKPVEAGERRRRLHRHHAIALAAPFVSYPLLNFIPWNPIYAAVVAMAIGGVATVLCRPDLLQSTWIGGLLFLGYHVAFLVGLEWSAPGYVERVWNLGALSGLMIFHMPLEELLFAVTFGFYWSGAYAHFTWRTPARAAR